MRGRSLAAVGVVWGLLSMVALSEPPRSIGTVTVPEVAVRATPRADGPDAGILFRGDVVIVDHAEGDDWIAIQPPAGALSWINHKFIQVNRDRGFPQNAVVQSEGEVRLAAGRSGENRPLDIRKAMIPDGTIVRVLSAGVKSEDDQSIWYPIQPPHDDYRYLPRSAVQTAGVANDRFVVKGSSPTKPTTTGIATASGVGTSSVVPAALAPSVAPAVAGAKPANWPNHPVWIQAEQASRNGEFDKAERLYFQLAREMNGANGDTDLANLCYTRVHDLRSKQLSKTGGDRGAEWAPSKSPRGNEPAFTAPQPDRRAVRDSSSQDTTETTARPDANAPKPQWSGSGVLRVAGFKVEGKQAYALETANGRPIIYAIAGPGIELDRSERKTVDLYGRIEYLPELRNVGLMIVTKVESVR